MRGRYVMKNENKTIVVVKIIAFVLAVIVAVVAYNKGCRAMEIIFFGAVAFAGTFFSLVMALSARDKRRANDYKSRNKEYLYDENSPEEYQS